MTAASPSSSSSPAACASSSVLANPLAHKPWNAVSPSLPLVTVVKRFKVRLPNGVAVWLQVAIGGAVDPETGMVVNLKDLKDWLRQEVLSPLERGEVFLQAPPSRGLGIPLEPVATWLSHQLLACLDRHQTKRTTLAPLSVRWLRLTDDTVSVQWHPPVEEPTAAAPSSNPLLSPLSPEVCVAMPYFLTRRYDFSASHRLYNPGFEEAKNWAIFYDCNNPNGHGHNYEVEVILTGEPDPATGMLMNLLDLDHLVQDRIISKVDHKHLNYDVPMFAGTITTAETVARVFFEQIEHGLDTHFGVGQHQPQLYCVRVHESRNNAAEYYGPQGLPPLQQTALAV
jgi:6-pyruvoyltetrahydropterin/6-carboxytetrahydropterin synthase